MSPSVPKPPAKVKAAKKRPNPVNTKRRKSEWARCYGGKARVAFVKSLPCAFMNPDSACEGLIENAHTECGGYGRKAGADKIVPICRYHHAMSHWCGIETLCESFGVDLQKTAAETDRRWAAHIKGLSPHTEP